MIMSLIQKKIKFKPRIKLNHNIYKINTPKSVQIVIDKNPIKAYSIRFSELSLNCTYSFLLYSFVYFMRSIQISNKYLK